MLLYIDNSALNRPYDDLTQGRIFLEAQCVLLTLMLIERGECRLIRSEVHDYENSRSLDYYRRRWVERCLNLAVIEAPLTEAEKQRAAVLMAGGMKAADAMHLATAEAAHAHVFLTCDDRLIRRYSGRMTAQTPWAFIESLRVI